MRRPHLLQSNRTCEMPRLAVYFDSESRVDPETREHMPYLITACFINYDNYKQVWKTYDGEQLSDFWRDVAAYGPQHDGKGRIHLYAHNMMYDLVATGGIPALCSLGYVVVNFFEKGNVFLLTMKKLRDGKVDKTLEFVSSTNYFPESLAALGKTVGLAKLEFDHARGGTPEEAKIYCRRDVEIVKKVVESFRDFVETENLGVMARTTPGQAFNAFRHRFMSHAIGIHAMGPALRLEREAYGGGRVECFRIGKYSGEFYGLDINGMFPYYMQREKYPVKLLTHKKRETLPRLRKHIANGYLVVAKCKISTPAPVVGIRYEGKYIFPTGTFWGAFSTPEVRYLLENNLIQEVGAVNIYEGGDIFTEYIQYFTSKRKQAQEQGDTIREKMYKLFANSLYGKFGQNGERWVRGGDAPLDDIGLIEFVDRDGREVVIKVFGGSFFTQLREEESYNSFPAIAAHVTGYARMGLLGYIHQAGPENVWYCDTDSLFVNAEGKKNLEQHIDPIQPGKLKIEKHADSLEIFGLKDYVFGQEIKRKGVRKGSQQLDATAFRAEVWPHLTSFIRSGQLNRYKNLTTVKKLTRIYSKGTVLSDGRVIPFNIQDLEDEKLHAVIAEQQRLLTREGADSLKQLRREILQLGGVKDAVYGHLVPAYLKRKRGLGLDQLVTELRSAGLYFADTEELIYTITYGKEGKGTL